MFKQRTVTNLLAVSCLLLVTHAPSSSIAFNLPGSSPSSTGSSNEPQRFDCSSLKDVSQYDSYKLNAEDIDYCIESGYSPPRHWKRPAGGVYKGGGSSVAFSSKCPWRPLLCMSFADKSPVARASVPTVLPGTNNRNLRLPPLRPPVYGRVQLPCGGSAQLDIGSLIRQGGQLSRNIRLGNVQSAVSSGVQIVNNLFGGGCNGGIMNMIQGAINMVMPAGCSLNITNGVSGGCNGTMISLPPGVTANIQSGGSMTFPRGGTFTVNGQTITITSGDSVSVQPGPNGSINVQYFSGPATANSTPSQTYNIANASELSVVPTDGVITPPPGAELPIDPTQNILPATTTTP